MAHPRRGLIYGVLVGALAGGPLCAFLYVGERVLGLAFVPFALFEAATKLLPGFLITRSIDVMVALIRRLGVGETSRAAKLTEAWLGVGFYIFLCAVAGALLFAALSRARGPGGRATVTASMALAFAAVSLAPRWAAGTLSARSMLWTLIGTGAFAAGVAFVQHRLSSPPAEREGVTSHSRRRVLVRLAGASAVLTFVGVGIGRRRAPEGVGGGGPAGEPWSRTHPLPNAQAPVAPVPGTRRELTPVEDHYRVDINIRPPVVDEERWRLVVDGLVREKRSFTLEQIRSGPAMDQFITLSCISNPVGGDLIGTTRWTGVSFARFLEELDLLPEATHLRLHAADGFDEVISLDQIRSDPRVMLTWAWDGMPLTAEHGFPLRVYIPDRFGMKQPKWIERIEAISGWQPGYWVRRGWDAEALVRATSVIDVIGPEAVRAPDGGLVLPIGGIAYAGVRGISRVELRVDDGPWTPAVLRQPLSDRTWVIWRYDWPFREGKHTVAVRCFDGAGQPQIADPAEPHPSGATGIHQRTFG